MNIVLSGHFTQSFENINSTAIFESLAIGRREAVD